ncbi:MULTISPECIES: hypothetical protein [unclassified Nocardiopsis]|uniref:hypothetical protein n=1 Tax=unclassified Nocardiopsis TaxID=2649073 RepID=UPI0033CC6217
MSGEVAANTQDADSGGESAEIAASYLRELPQDFQEAVNEAKGLLTHDPTIGGWGGFAEDHESHMNEVQRHAATLASNVRSGAGRISATDQSSEDGFTGSQASAPMDASRHLNPNIRVNRHHVGPV